MEVSDQLEGQATLPLGEKVPNTQQIGESWYGHSGKEQKPLPLPGIEP
jgi:hypothetical protein